MTASAPSPAAPTQRRRRRVLKVCLSILLVMLLIPLALQGLAGYSRVHDVGQQVSSLGGRIHTTPAVPEFMQSLMGKEWDGWGNYYGGVDIDEIMLDQTPTSDTDLI